ncbi:MAG TPA: NADH-quinone oxidoreductase subunit NuoB [Elusimicrobiales bacterium]|nr:NADH-quinone oxidoreductase subunit NuoB [Elusimicrobiales bacterium]
MTRIFLESLRKGRLSRAVKASSAGPEYEKAGQELRALIARHFGRSLQIREVDAGSCGACESEIISACNPIYDIQRFGVDFAASPRHADALLVTGPVTRNMETALLRTYEAMSGPKFVITCGDCALDGGAFKDSYYCAGGAGALLPVAAHVPGCPPHPMALVEALLRLLDRLNTEGQPKM